MSSVLVTPQYGIIVRCSALELRKVSEARLLEAMETDAPLDRSADLISFGPSFGNEALETFVTRLEALGLIYWGDFCEFVGDYPEWCRFRAEDACPD